MGNSSSVDTNTSAEQSSTMISSGSAVSGALSSLWSTSSDKDDTCVQWGLVHASYIFVPIVDIASFPQSKKERIIGFFSCLCLGLICFGLVSCTSCLLLPFTC